MAVDTRAKRQSVLGIMTLPPPDNTIGAQDRGHVAGDYAGITFGAPVDTTLGVRIFKYLFGTFFGSR